MGKVRIIEEEEGEAIKALGSLFKLTLRHLWDDDASTDSRLVALFDEQNDILPTKSIDDNSNDPGIANLRSEDMGFMDEMKALGLPLSFRTNKKWKTREGHQKKGIKDRLEEVNVMFREENKEVDRPCLPNDFVQSNPVEEEKVHELSGSWFLGNEVRDSVLTSETTDSQSCKLDCIYDSGEWQVHWDPFYKQIYFYNIKTEESRWEPPVGMEHLAYSDEIHKDVLFREEGKDVASTLNVVPDSSSLSDLKASDYASVDDEEVDRSYMENDRDKPLDCLGAPPTDDVPAKKSDDLTGAIEEISSLVDTYQEASVENQCLDISIPEEEGYVIKKKTRRTQASKIFSSSNKGTRTEGVIDEYSPIVDKYWGQRYTLFSRFDKGIKMDEEGWFSVTPETLAKHHASRCNEGLVIDCFTGVGGNAIQFASRRHYVIAIDLDQKKLDLAKHNAAIYGVADRIDFMKGDFFVLAPNLKADTVFLSPPWGGPDYIKASPYDMNTMLKPRDGVSLFKAAMNIASTIVMFLPRNVDINQLAEIALSTSPPWSLEVEKNYLNGKLKAITAYYFRPDSS